MKNKYIFMIILSLFLFLPFNKVSARNMEINFDINDKFNYFYEFKNNTPFYNFLLSKGKNLRDYLNSYYDSGSDDYMILIYSGSQLYTRDMNSKYIDDTYYIICVLEEYNSTHPFKLCIDDTKMYIDWGGYYNATFYYFDYDSNLLYAEKKVNVNNNYYNKPVLNAYEVENSVTSYFSGTYFMSSYYYSTYDLKYYSDYDYDFVITDVIIDDIHYLLDDNENYSSIKSSLRKFFSFGDLKYYDTYDTFLEYYRLNKYLCKEYVPLSLLEAIDDYQEYPFDENYSSVNISTIKNSYYFIPKSTDYDLDLYYFTSSDNVELTAVLYDITTNNINMIDDRLVICPSKNNYYKFKFINNIISSNQDGDIKYVSNMYNQMYYFYLNGNKSNLSIYYDTRAYDVVKYSDSSHSFININTNEEISFKDEDFYSVNYKAELDLISETKEDLQENNISNYLSINNIVFNVKSFVSTITGFVVMIFSLVSSLFTALPASVQSVFQFSLLAGAMILIYKLIRG